MPGPEADPVPTALTAPFWDGCRRGELVLQRCLSCGRFIHFPEPSCPWCGSPDCGWEAVDRRGRLVTFTEIHRSFAPGFASDVPYVVAVAELDVQEGVRIVANTLPDVAAGELCLDARIEVGFVPRPGFGAVPAIGLSQPKSPRLT